MQCTWYTQCRPTHPIQFQCWASVAAHCWFNAGQSYSTLAQHWNRIGWFSCVYLTTIRVTLYAPKGHNPDNTIHCPNCGKTLGHCPRRLANIIPAKTVQALNHEYNLEYIFSEDFWNTKVLNLGTSNVIFDMFTRTGVQKWQPFPTHITPLCSK